MHRQLFALQTGKSLSKLGASTQRNKTLPRGSICVSCIASPGLVVLVDSPSQTNQQINSVIPRDLSEAYYWFQVLSNLGQEICSAGSGGSVLSNLSTSRFSNLRVLFPHCSLRSAFHSVVSVIMARHRNTSLESTTLGVTRDTLLPKLITGETVAGIDLEDLANAKAYA